MFKRILMAIVFIVFSFGSAQAALITYDYSGHFYQASGGSKLGIEDGITFTGTFVYDDLQAFTSDGNYLCDYTLTVNGYTITADDSRIHVHDGYWSYLGVYAEDFSGDQELTTAVNSVRMIFCYTDLFPDANLPGSELTLNDFSTSGFINLSGDSSRFVGCFDSLSTGTTSVPAPVPEPCTMILFGSGLLGLAGYTRKKSKK